MFRKLKNASRGLWARTVGVYRSRRRPGSVSLFHQHRCGSSVVGRMLGKHPEISWRYEVITHSMLEFEKQHGTREGWKVDPIDVIDRQRRENPSGWFGCEITTHNLNKLGISSEQMVSRLLENQFDRFIILERRNHLRRFISSRIAAANNLWHIKSEEQRKQTSITMPVDAAGMDDESGPILERLAEDTRCVTEFLELTQNHPTLHLVYEEHIEQDPTVAYRLVCEHLGVVPESIEPPLVRGNVFPISEMLDNYQEVVAALTGTEYEWMLTA